MNWPIYASGKRVRHDRVDAGRACLCPSASVSCSFALHNSTHFPKLSPVGTVDRMPSAVLADTTNTHQNVLQSPTKGKKRRPISSAAFKRPNGKQLGSSQPKSQFEEEVLEKLTQDINGLKHKNSERDQQWSRPPLDDFDPRTESLCFQQIESEEGTLHGGKTTIKLFGATEVYRCPGAAAVEPY